MKRTRKLAVKTGKSGSSPELPRAVISLSYVIETRRRQRWDATANVKRQSSNSPCRCSSSLEDIKRSVEAHLCAGEMTEPQHFSGYFLVTNRIKNNGCSLCATFLVKFIELSQPLADTLGGVTRHSFLHGSALRRQAVNTNERATIEGRHGYSMADDYRIRRVVVLRAVESLMTLTSRSSHNHVACQDKIA